MSGYDNWDAGLNSDDEDEIPLDLYHTREGILFLIEATPSMLAPEMDNSDYKAGQLGWRGQPANSKMELVLRCAWAMMRKKVISAPKDLIGILIFNTEESTKSGHGTIRNSQLAFDLNQINAKMISDLHDLLRAAEHDPDHLARLYAPRSGSDTADVGSAFRDASTIFRTRMPNTGAKRIFLVTDNDNPAKGEPEQLKAAFNNRRDLLDLGYDLDPFFVPPTKESHFDLSAFYTEVITAGFDSDEGPDPPRVYPSLSSTLHDMVQSMRSKEATKRVAFSIPFYLAEDKGLVIGIKGFALIGEERKRQPVRVDLDTRLGEQVISKTIYKDANTGEVINFKTEVKKYFSVGKTDPNKGTKDEKFFFDNQDVNKMKTLGRSPGLWLLGFKPKEDYLRFEEQVKHSYFTYPNEETYAGSTRTFAALLDSMDRKGKVGFGFFIARRLARPQMVVMIAQPEKLAPQSGVQLLPPGIHLCQLPFKDDIRSHGLVKTVSVVPPLTEEQMDDDDYMPDLPAVNALKLAIKFYSKPYDPDAYPNPSLNFHYETLAALALNHPLPEPADKTIPAYRFFDKRVGDYLETFKEKLGILEDDDEEVKPSKGVKRGRTATDDQMRRWAEVLADKGVKATLEELKQMSKGLGEKVTGTKTELYDRVTKVLGKAGFWEQDSSEEEVSPSKKKKAKR